MVAKINSFGNKNGPVMVCIPGLLGGPEDFRDIIAKFEKDLHILVYDPNADRRELGLNKLTVEIMQEINFDCNAGELVQELKKYTQSPVWMCGVSIGGKIVYDFSIKYPELFRGAVITDVGLGSFSESELYYVVEDIVNNINLNQSWPDLKKEFRLKIEDDSLRSLIQSQIHYPSKQPPATWKIGMANFKKMINRQSTDDQFDSYQKINNLLAEKGSFIHVMKASKLSGINANSLERLKKLNSIKIYYIENSSHFLQFTHKDILMDLIKQLIEK